MHLIAIWIGVRQRFRRFHASLSVTPAQRDDALAKQLDVREVLHRAYYGVTSDDPIGIIVGSWGKGTQVSPPSDIDVFFTLPVTEFERFNSYADNKQSSLLQAVRATLLATWPQTGMRGDGQVVVVDFNSIAVEIVPVFRYNNIEYVMPDTNDGGSWRRVRPFASLIHIDEADRLANGNVRTLAQMTKTWRRECNVPSLKSFHLELLVANFMQEYPYREHDYFWYDWFMRDFFNWLCGRARSYLLDPSTNWLIYLGDDWLSRAESARDRALKACVHEYNDETIEAGSEWQMIFGVKIPIHVLG